MMRIILWAAALLGVAIYIASLQRMLRSALLRGDMYRDIAARLDKRIAELSDGSAT
jgi:hypothetical protein